jgi:hypothetical protein
VGRHGRTPSLAHLVWPVALLPLSGLLVYVVAWCPGDPEHGGLPIASVVATYLAPPLLLAGFILTLRLRPRDYWVRILVAILLGCGFLAAGFWGSLLWFVSVGMAGC